MDDNFVDTERFEDAMAASLASVPPDEFDKLTRSFEAQVGSKEEIAKRLDKVKKRSAVAGFSGSFLGLAGESPTRNPKERPGSDHASEVGKKDEHEEARITQAMLTTMTKDLRAQGILVQGLNLALTNFAKQAEGRHEMILKALNAHTTYTQRLEHELRAMRDIVTGISREASSAPPRTGLSGPSVSLSPGAIRVPTPQDGLSDTDAGEYGEEVFETATDKFETDPLISQPAIVWQF